MPSADVRQKVFRIPSTVVISVGLCWDFVGVDPVDLDISAVCFTKEGRFLDVVFFNHLFPQGTDEAALRSEFLVDPVQLPYMFLSGDNTIGGEEENQMPGIALAAKRKAGPVYRRGRKSRVSAAVENIFSRLYEEEELDDVQDALDDRNERRGKIYDENGELLNALPRRELCDEMLTFVTHKVPQETGVIFICVTSYTGVDFTLLSTAKLIIYNETGSERVGVIDLKSTTGNGSANLSCIMLRVPPECGDVEGSGNEDAGLLSAELGPSWTYWDLRELNIRTFGYTFVDVLPLMQDVLGVPRDSRAEALQGLPDYSLAKTPLSVSSSAHPLSDIRFGLGWDGEHDLDAFMVLLDAENNYVDHLHPKDGRLQSTAQYMARHSGDALNGLNTAGDEEFIDLLTYRVPPNVRTILFGATYVESFGPRKKHFQSLRDIPNVYLRLQNRAMEQPYSVEIDRWNYYSHDNDGDDDDDGADHEQEKDPHIATTKKKEKSKAFKATYTAADGTKQPVRTVLLGLLVKKGEMPMADLYPHHGQVSNHPPGDTAMGTSEVRQDTQGQESMADSVPVFDYMPAHLPLPVDVRSGFTRVIPFLQCLTAYACGKGGANGAGASPRVAGHRRSTGRGDVDDPMHTLTTGANMVGWDTASPVVVGGRQNLMDEYHHLWKAVQEEGRLTQHYALEIQFVEVLTLQPQLPDRFKCHAEVWVYGRNAIPPSGVPMSVYGSRVFRTPYLVNRDHLAWDAKEASCIVLVQPYDRLRVMVYEYAGFGCADIDLSHLPKLWQGDSKGRREEKCGGVQDRFNTIDHVVTLQGGGPMSKIDLQVRISRVPVAAAMNVLQKEVHSANTRRDRHINRERNRKAKGSHKEYSPCRVM